jgi:hypothetical protein
MNTLRLEYPISVLCCVFGVSRSGYYAWSNGEPSPRAQADERLKVAIEAVHKQSRETYGTLRVQPELAAKALWPAAIALHACVASSICAVSRSILGQP